MKRAKLIFGVAIAGIGAIGSAFTMRYTGAPASGWYSVDKRTIADDPGTVTYGQAHVSTATFSSNSLTNPPSTCDSDASFICAVYFNQNDTNASGHVTGDYPVL